MKVLGIDPGNKIFGWAIVDDNDVGPTGWFSPADKIQRDTQLWSIACEVSGLLLQHKPNLVAVETVWIPKEGKRGRNPQSVFKLAECRGAILTGAGGYTAGLEDIAPSTAKKALTGSGRADKEAMIRFATLLLRVKFGDINEHEADALGIAMAGLAKKQAERVGTPF